MVDVLGKWVLMARNGYEFFQPCFPHTLLQLWIIACLRGEGQYAAVLDPLLLKGIPLAEGVSLSSLERAAMALLR